MCGIAGICALGEKTLERSAKSTVQGMIDSLIHRGPDGGGICMYPSVCLGHRRLSIIDLSKGAQPMTSHDGCATIVFNGEIYNFPELKKTLQQKGARFISDSDTEVILEAYRVWGTDCLNAFEGMFAFALYDHRKKILFLARDRFGKKPLFYTVQNGMLYFASEITALTTINELSFHIAPAGLTRFLAFEYVPPPQTIYDEVQSLLPAHFMLVNGGRIVQERYWDLPYPNEQDSRSPTELEEELLGRLRLAVQRRMISDVPLGVFLSGGLDSSIVTALMAEVSSQPVETFSIGFSEASYDESRYARIVAKAFATNHHEEILEAETCADLLPQIIQQMDVPMADASIAPTYLLSRLTRRSVTVALGGDGSDELWAGYENYAAFRIALLYQKWPGLIRSCIEYLATFLPKSAGYVNLHLAMQTFLNGCRAPDWLRIERLLCSFEEQGLQTLLEPAFVEQVPHILQREVLFNTTKMEFEHWQPQSVASPMARAFHVYCRQFLPEDILVKIDRASMLHSLEVRAPFLDRDLAEFTAKLPLRHKLSFLKGKWLLRRAMRHILPRQILTRNKRGFQIPVAAWLRGKMRPLLEALLDPVRLKKQGIFQTHAVQKLLKEHISGACDHRKPLWTILVLQLWLEAHTERA